MTPLAMRIARELTLPLNERTFNDRCGLLGMMDDIHCFDITEVAAVSCELGQLFRDKGIPAEAEFLPAPKTWIEYRDPSHGYRIGALLLESGNSILAEWSNRDFGSEKHLGYRPNRLAELLPTDGLSAHALYRVETLNRILLDDVFRTDWLLANGQILGALALINSPRLIGRKQHMPHAGLQRRLASAKGLVGKFPLHAWTELTLSIDDIGKAVGSASHEAHYSGEKCRHFCRAHLRVRNGRLERVTAHWRGNPALGIKRTRYNVTL